MNLQPTGLEVMDWIYLAHESDKQHDNEPLGSIKCGTSRLAEGPADSL